MIIHGESDPIALKKFYNYLSIGKISRCINHYRQILHGSGIFNSKPIFQKWDGGLLYNLKKYHSIWPPSYD